MEGGQTGNLTAVYHSYTGKTAPGCSNVNGKSEKKNLHTRKTVPVKGPQNLFSQSASYYEQWALAQTQHNLPKFDQSWILTNDRFQCQFSSRR